MRKSSRRTHTTGSQRQLLYGVALLIFVYLLVVLVRGLLQSALLDKRDRINVVFYGQEAMLVSFGLTDNVHYIVSFPHEHKVSVPGGYGRYNVGALGKLASIEKDDDLMLRTFASMTSSYVDFYVYPKNSGVFEDVENSNFDYNAQKLISQLNSGDYSTNATFVDKLYVSFLLSKRRTSDFIPLKGTANENKLKELEYSEKQFQKEYKGFFYHQSLREESKDVQIVYESYPGALTLTRVIEGQGIRIVDLSAAQDSIQQRCMVRYSDDTSKTATYLKNRFNCAIEKQDVENADIMLIMGEELTEEWK